jgi:hypothetical protein
MTAALEGSEWSAVRPGRTLPPGKTRYPFYRRLVGPQGRGGRAENLVPIEIRSRTVQLYRLSHPATHYKIVKQLKSFKIITVAPTCFGLHTPSSGSSQPVLSTVLWLHMKPYAATVLPIASNNDM